MQLPYESPRGHPRDRGQRLLDQELCQSRIGKSLRNPYQVIVEAVGGIRLYFNLGERQRGRFCQQRADGVKISKSKTEDPAGEPGVAASSLHWRALDDRHLCALLV